MPPAQKPMRSTSSRAGDLPDRVDGRENAPDVVVEVPVAFVLRRVAPAEHERRQSAAHRVFDETASGPQIKEVVPPDRRWHDEHWASLHGFGRRLVLDDLGVHVSINHRARSDRQIPADLVRRAVDRRRHAAVVHHIAEPVLRPANQAHATRLERALDGGGVAEQVVGWRSGALQHAEDETGGRRLTTVAAQIVEHLVGEFAAGQIALTKPTVDRVFGPGWVLEPPVLGIWRDVRRSDQNAGKLAGQLAALAAHGPHLGERLAEIAHGLPEHRHSDRVGSCDRVGRDGGRGVSPARGEQAPPSAGPRQCGPMSPGGRPTLVPS